jgi:hypothetical protein
MAKRRRVTTDHAEGEHGPLTRRRFIAQLHAPPAESAAEERLERQRRKAAEYGKRRLVEDRQQHDEGEKNSERERLFKEVKRGRNDGPSDNIGSLHGVLDHRERRADFKVRGRDGFLVKRKRKPAMPNGKRS